MKNNLRSLVKSDAISDWEYEEMKKEQRKKDRMKKSARSNKRVWSEDQE